MSRHHIINQTLTVRMAVVVALIVLAVLSSVVTAAQVHAWIDENRSEISGELGEVEWEGIAHIGWNTGDGSGIHYTGSTLTQTDSVVHALHARSRGVERCGIVEIDTDWDEEWEVSDGWITGGSETGFAMLGACSNISWLLYSVANVAEHRAWLSNGDTAGGEHSAWVAISIPTPGW